MLVRKIRPRFNDHEMRWCIWKQYYYHRYVAAHFIFKSEKWMISRFSAQINPLWILPIRFTWKNPQYRLFVNLWVVVLVPCYIGRYVLTYINSSASESSNVRKRDTHLQIFLWDNSTNKIETVIKCDKTAEFWNMLLLRKKLTSSRFYHVKRLVFKFSFNIMIENCTHHRINTITPI